MSQEELSNSRRILYANSSRSFMHPKSVRITDREFSYQQEPTDTNLMSFSQLKIQPVKFYNKIQNNIDEMSNQKYPVPEDTFE